ncbi:MAG: creatininase family protein [Flavobacteriaceae bacterium]
MARPYILSENNWKNIKDTRFEMAVLPWGATEAHNYHLPYGTDNIEGTAFAAEAARIAWDNGAKVIVLPTVPFGVNTGQTDIYLDMNMRPSTQQAVLKDILTVLNRQRIKKFMLLNSHGGNNWKSIIRELGLDFPEMFLCVTEWYHAKEKNDYFDEPGDHAGELETSLILHLRPDLVLSKEEWGEGKEKKNKISAFNEGWTWTERPWSKITEDTGVGNPEAATAEKGKRYFDQVSRRLADLFIELCRTDIDSLYK